MPIYMDRHNVPGIEAKSAAEAHKSDILIQHEFGCRCMTYWVDEERGNAFCLIDAPNIDAVQNMHNKAHGLIPHDIIQVNSNVVEAFLGRIQDPKGYTEADDPSLKIFNDPAFRIILFTKISNPVLLKKNLGKKKTTQLLKLYNYILHDQIHQFEGREVETVNDGKIVSFVSVTQAVDCAIAIQNKLHIAGELLSLRISINAGMPVDKSKELFGETVRLARYLTLVGKDNQIMLAAIIREIYKGNSVNLKYTRNNLSWILPKDENFLQLLFDSLTQNFHNPDFNLGMLSQSVSMSRSNLYRKCKSLMSLSPNALLRDFRLLMSLKLMKTGRNISETAFDTGFTSPSYFTKCFLKKFGINPLAYVKALSKS